jgi:cadmium resistance protein CadD (predicted permease)
MKLAGRISFLILAIFFALVGVARADDFTYQFLGSPLLVLLALLVLDAIAFLYHKARR